MILIQRWVEKIFAALTIFFYTGAISPFIGDGHPAAILEQNLPYVAAGISILLMLARWQRVLSIVLREKMLWLLIGFALASPFWSDLPGVTFGEVSALIRIAIFGTYFATRYQLDEQLEILAFAMGMAVFGSFIFSTVLPSYGQMGMGYISNSQDWTHAGAWRGVYIHKNLLGPIMSLSILVFLGMMYSGQYPAIMSQMSIAVAVVCLLASTSVAGIGILIIIFSLLPFIRALRWNYTLLIPLTIVFILCAGMMALVISTNLETIFSAIDRDITISGRTKFWPLIIDQIHQRPWLGYGYEAFWHGGWEGKAANIWIYLKKGFEPPHAHNGFLEVALGLGFVGLAIFLASLASTLLRSVAWLRSYHNVLGLVPIVFLIFLLVANITESMLMNDDIVWFLYVAVTISTRVQLVNIYKNPAYESNFNEKISVQAFD